MLESDYQSNLNSAIAKLPCLIELPENWGDFFEDRGTLPSVPDEPRRFARFYLRTKAILEIGPSLPAIKRERDFYCIFCRDVSRQGISFLHSAQLYPGEECLLWLPTRTITARIVRCARLNARCFIVGATLCAR